MSWSSWRFPISLLAVHRFGKEVALAEIALVRPSRFPLFAPLSHGEKLDYQDSGAWQSFGALDNETEWSRQATPVVRKYRTG
jgi:hypothetical protein